MPTADWGLIGLGFAICAVLLLLLSRNDDERQRRGALHRILSESTLTRPQTERRAPLPSLPLLNALAAVSPVLGGRDSREVSQQLNRAGFHQAAALVVYRAASTVLWLLLTTIGGLLLWTAESPPGEFEWVAVFAVPLLLAMRLPALVVAQRASARSDAMQDGLPELIDLLVICIEGGQTFDAALRRAAREISRHNALLASELDRVTLKIRAGAARTEALRELADRVGLDDMRELTTMIIQAERYGVTLGDSLRIHADAMRVRRMQRAEEQAAQLPVKVMGPLMACLLPALIIILFGPSAMSLSKVLG